MTDMKQNVILNHYETELGCNKPLKNIKNIVQNHAGESNQLHINDMPNILEKRIWRSRRRSSDKSGSYFNSKRVGCTLPRRYACITRTI